LGGQRGPDVAAAPLDLPKTFFRGVPHGMARTKATLSVKKTFLKENNPLDQR